MTTVYRLHEGNITRISEEAWTLGRVHTDRQNYDGKKIFYPYAVNGMFCTIYLQGETQGYADRIETSSHHPSYINLISRMCLGVEQHCIWYYQEHPWFSNLYTDIYDKMEHISLYWDQSKAILQI